MAEHKEVGKETTFVNMSLSVRDLTSSNGVLLATTVMIVRFSWAGLRPRHDSACNSDLES